MQINAPIEMRHLKTKKLYLQVYDEICNYIKDNDLGPGDKLPTEAEMTRTLGVSRNVLREAIKALEITGIILSKPGVGITICKTQADLSSSTLISKLNIINEPHIENNVQEIRKVLKLGFARSAFDAMTPEILARLEAELEVMRAHAKKQTDNDSPASATAFARADANFHSILFESIRNPLLSSLLELFWASKYYFDLKLRHSSIEATCANHERIISGLKSNNYDEFYSAMLIHFK